jgi:hypothetical protein
MSDWTSWLQIYLGDGSVVEPFARLKKALSAALEVKGLARRESQPSANYHLGVGRADRWVAIALDSRGVPPLDDEVLARLLAAHFTVALIETAEERAVLRISLFREADLIDRFCNAASGSFTVSVGSPEKWAELLGTRRNASRLESCWSAAGSRDGADVLAQTAAIIGWRFD